MGLLSEQTNNLNQIVSIISEKSTAYFDTYIRTKPVQQAAEKKLLFDLINDAELIAQDMKPKPVELIGDLQALKKRLNK